MHFYFAYGSNMNRDQMNKRCPGATLLGPAMLPDFRLAFTIYSPNRECGCADIVHSPGDTVHGLLYQLPDTDLRTLDKYEGHPNQYLRFSVAVHTPDGGVIESESYHVVNKTPGLHPSPEYLGLILDASVEHGFPELYIEMLRNTRTQT